MKESALLSRLPRRCYMKKDREDELDLFEGELNLCHALLDVAGPKPLAGIIAKARLGYENAVLWIGTVRDPMKLRRITAKIDRLRERLSRYSLEARTTAAGVAANAVLQLNLLEQTCSAVLTGFQNAHAAQRGTRQFV